MKNFRKYSYLILWLGLALTVAVAWIFGSLELKYTRDDTGSMQTSSGEDAGTKDTSQDGESSGGGIVAVNSKEEELVGIWVPFMSLNIQEKTQEAFEENYKQIVASAKDKGVNALFVHVRPYGDAFYPSARFPWSHILTGEQGKDPGYDPLAFMVAYTHENDMEFHAWINPLRVKTDSTPTALSEDNPYTELKSEYPFYFMEHEGAVYLNPSYPYVRSLIAGGAVEIVQNYDVDGIHFDDYFYPTQDSAIDSAAYESYTQNVDEPVPLEDWRTANINALVSEVYEKIKRENPEVVFGISPGGNIGNNQKINADIETWCAVSGYIDYICPQLYYSFENRELGYAEALEAWLNLERHDDLKMYIGLALYKAGTDADDGTWLTGDDTIKRQIEAARSAACNGVILYSSEYLDKAETQKEVENAMAVIRPESN